MTRCLKSLSTVINNVLGYTNQPFLLAAKQISSGHKQCSYCIQIDTDQIKHNETVSKYKRGLWIEVNTQIRLETNKNWVFFYTTDTTHTQMVWTNIGTTRGRKKERLRDQTMRKQCSLDQKVIWQKWELLVQTGWRETMGKFLLSSAPLQKYTVAGDSIRESLSMYYLLCKKNPHIMTGKKTTFFFKWSVVRGTSVSYKLMIAHW